jgi:hypothetical protein
VVAVAIYTARFRGSGISFCHLTTIYIVYSFFIKIK